MNREEFKQLWTEAGKYLLSEYERRHGTDVMPFNTIVPEFSQDGALRMHFAYVDQEEAAEETEDSPEEEKPKKMTPAQEAALKKANEVKAKKKRQDEQEKDDEDWDNEDWSDSE